MKCIPNEVFYRCFKEKPLELSSKNVLSLPSFDSISINASDSIAMENHISWPTFTAIFSFDFDAYLSHTKLKTSWFFKWLQWVFCLFLLFWHPALLIPLLSIWKCASVLKWMFLPPILTNSIQNFQKICYFDTRLIRLPFIQFENVSRCWNKYFATHFDKFHTKISKNLLFSH